MTGPTDPRILRPVRAEDDLTLLTALIHAAYATHAATGLRYWGTHQTVEDTAKRLASGHGLVMECKGDYIGTITVCPPQPESPVPLYRQPRTWTICQFAVAPSMKGQGIGKALHSASTSVALRHGADTLALDTAESAKRLIAMYESWGYVPVGRCDWRPFTNYPSIVLSRPLPLEA